MSDWKHEEFEVSFPPLSIEKFLGADFVNLKIEDRRGMTHCIDLDEKQWELLAHSIGLITEHSDLPKRSIVDYLNEEDIKNRGKWWHK
jgi:hypothetical protein